MDKKQWLLNIAKEVAKASKDPSTQVGCVIVNKDNSPISFGYNGFIKGCDESFMTWERPEKYDLVIHAEINALLFAKHADLSQAVMYLTHGPCANCMKTILQSGIRKVYIAEDGPAIERGSLDDTKAMMRMLFSTDSRFMVLGPNGFDHSYLVSLFNVLTHKHKLKYDGKTNSFKDLE